MIDIHRTPSPRDLRLFALWLPFFFGAVGAFRWFAGSPRTAVLLWGVGIALALLAGVVPSARGALYRGWMLALFPIAWVVSFAILVVVYFVVATPTAVVLRLVGRDPMQRRFDRSADSYWTTREPVRDRSRYFRQF